MRRLNANENLVYEYTPTSGYYHDDNIAYDDYLITATLTITITLNESDTFQIRHYKVHSQGMGGVIIRTALSNTWIERIKCIAT